MDSSVAEFVQRYWPSATDQPKHQKLRAAFTHSITDGYWTTGAKLPTESELVAHTPCSLGTVQRALRELVSDGLIERRRGSGTTVANMARRIAQPWHIRFYDETGSGDYLPISTRVLYKQVTADKGAWSEALEQGERKVVKIERIFIVADEFDIYSVFYTLADRFPELADLPAAALHGTNLKNLIATRHHMPVHKVRQVMRFAPKPPAWVAANCNWRKNSPATILSVVAYSYNDQPMYYQDFYIPISKYTLDLGTPMLG
jgi:GntR family transcriptional regulator